MLKGECSSLLSGDLALVIVVQARNGTRREVLSYFLQIPGGYSAAYPEQFGIKPGQKVVFIPHKKSLRVVIVSPIEEAYGFLKGIDTDVERDEEGRV